MFKAATKTFDATFWLIMFRLYLKPSVPLHIKARSLLSPIVLLRLWQHFREHCMLLTASCAGWADLALEYYGRTFCGPSSPPPPIWQQYLLKIVLSILPMLVKCKQRLKRFLNCPAETEKYILSIGCASWHHSWHAVSLHFHSSDCPY